MGNKDYKVVMQQSSETIPYGLAILRELKADI